MGGMWVLAAWGLLGVSFGAVPPGDHRDDSLQKEVLPKYASALKRLEEFYSHVRIVGTGRYRAYPSSVDRQFSVEFLAKGDARRLTRTRTVDGKGEGVGTRYAWVTTPNLCFELFRAPDRSNYVVRSLAPGGCPQLSDQMRFNGQLCDAPFSLADIRVRELLESRNFRVSGVSWVDAGGTKLLRMQFQRSAPAGFTSGWILVDPQQAWVLREYETTSASQSTGGHGVLEYRGSGDGIPLLRRATLDWTQKGKATESHELRVETIAWEEVPEEAFTLSAFGITAPVQGQAPTARRMFSLIVVVALLALLFLVLYRRWRRAKAA